MKLNRPSGTRAFLSRSWSVSWPMTLIMFFEFLIGLTDVYIAGRVSKEVQAAYGFVIQLYFIFIVIANALTVGTVSVVSRLFTSKDKDELTETVFSSIVTATIAGVVLVLVGILLGPEMIRILNIPVVLGTSKIINFCYRTLLSLSPLQWLRFLHLNSEQSRPWEAPSPGLSNRLSSPSPPISFSFAPLL